MTTGFCEMRRHSHLSYLFAFLAAAASAVAVVRRILEAGPAEEESPLRALRFPRADSLLGSPFRRPRRSAFPAFLYAGDDDSRRRKGSGGSSSLCVPRFVHLAQRDNVRPKEEPKEYEPTTASTTRTTAAAAPWVVSMTLSFALDYENCPPSRIDRIVVEYGPVDSRGGGSGGFAFPSGDDSGALRGGGDDDDDVDGGEDGEEATVSVVVVVPRREEGGEGEPGRASVRQMQRRANSARWKKRAGPPPPPRSLSPTHVEPVQFDYQTREMRWKGRVFRSDWLYHVPLPGVEAGRRPYWHRIRVFLARNSSSSSSEAVRQPKEAAETATEPEWPPGSGSGAASSSILRRRQLERARSGTAGAKETAAVPVAAASASTPRRGFVTPPLPGAPTRLALVGDLGQTYHSTLTMLHIWLQAQTTTNATLARQRYWEYRQRRAKGDGAIAGGDDEEEDVPVTNVIIAGDMSYADSDPQRWSSWLDLMEPLLRSVPTHVAPGNHEVECDDSGNLFQFYENYFANPNRVQEPYRRPYRPRSWDWWRGCSTPSHFQYEYDYGNAYYSYRHGLATVVVLSSYSQSGVNSTQYRWLENELANEYDRTATPWLVVVFHAPLYTTFLGHQDEAPAAAMREAMEDLFMERGVNLVVSGHDHAYLRTHPMYRSERQLDGRAPVYWTLGAGGNREGHSAGYVRPEPEPWVATRSLADFGFGSLLLANATHARLTWTRDGAGGVGRNGGLDEMAVDDDVWIVNPHA